MAIAEALSTLHDVAATARTGDLAEARIADVRALVGRELALVERTIAAHLEAGVAPATESAHHLFAAGGKRVRPLALLLAAACYGPIDDRVRDLAAVAELVHMATLLHDDVVDDGDQRRGLPTSRKVWGNAVSVLAGDLLLVESLRLAGTADTTTWTELVATLGRLVDGEVIQLRGRLTVSLDQATYFAIVHGKTASLFEWALRAGARAGGAVAREIDALGRFGAHLGVAFQLVDDVLDYAGDESATGKTTLADLAEGKVTLPLLLAAEADPELVDLVARARAADGDAARVIAARVVGSGSLARVRERAFAETEQALAALHEAIPACRARDVLADVATGLTSRLS